MIHKPTGEFIDIVYLAHDDSDERMIKCGLTAEMTEEIKMRWDNYLAWLDERNEEDTKAELNIYVDKGQDILPGEMFESEFVDQ